MCHNILSTKICNTQPVNNTKKDVTHKGQGAYINMVSCHRNHNQWLKWQKISITVLHIICQLGFEFSVLYSLLIHYQNNYSEEKACVVYKYQYTAQCLEAH